ncbi:SRPBCC family protein [Methylocapsa polymorpha]|uniref:SRPBCC family protein n=1 Tax=Methylocapsa polymorpha TaxID=3080828 RepID=A0ABZ0HUS7_9HYPH|nr:SRPBCC family protein [Methylocapsa sp. RX1]
MLTKQPITKKLNAPAEKAWEAISRIGRLDIWFPIIATCSVEGDGVGACRRMTTSDGGEITDIIQEIDHATRRLAYLRVKSPFPVTCYQGTVEVFDSFDSLAVIVWTIEFESDPKDSASVAELVKEAISAGLDGMERDLQSDFALSKK